MARLDTYKKDLQINGLDYLAGSSYVTTGINGPVYETAKFSMLDLARFFGSYTNINGYTYDIAQMYEDIQNNITSLAAVSINITALADATQALAQVDIDLQTAFSNGISAAVSEINLTLTSLSNADLALASVVTNLETSFTTQLTEAVATINTELTTLTTADSALATSITELETTFNTDLTAAVAIINTELTTLSTADAALATSITELETTFNTDLTAAVATINTELTTLSTADAALATSITELETSFATDLTDAVATINTELTTLSTADEALATSITTLETTFTTDLATTNAAITQEATTRANAIEAEATARQALETSFTTALGETNAAIVAEASTRSTADLAEATAREALATSIATDIATVTAAVTAETLARTTEDEALATSITTLETNFNTELSTTNAAIVTEATARAEADAAEATARETLAASIATDIAAVTAAVTTEQNARTTADEAIAEDITTLTAAIETETTNREAAIAIVNQAVVDETTARSTADTTLNTAISIKPNVYRQADAPAVTVPIGSVWYDTDDNNKTYILVAGTPNVWTLTDDARIGATVSSLATAQSSLNTLTTNLQSEATKITKLQAQYTFDTNGDVNGLADGTIVSNAVNDAYQNALADANTATAASIQTLSATISKIYKQASAPTGTIPTNSIWYDTDDSDKSYVYDGTNWIYTVDATRATTASVQVVSDAVGDVQGKLVASHAITVDAGGKIAGLKLLSNGTTSEITFTADTFKIFNTSSDIAPFTLDGTSLKLNVPLNGVSGTFSGELVAATGSFTGSLNVNSKFLVNSAGSVQIYGGDLVGNARFEILDDSGNSKYRLYGGGINLNSWTGDNALSGGKIFYGSVAEIYSGNGTTVTTDHALVINVYGGSKKLITRSDNFQMYNSAGGDGVILTVNGSIRATGNITAFYSSDRRLKDNIKPIENALDKVNKIGGYEFDWNENQSDFEGHDIGVVAQEIQDIAPELVTQRPDGYLAVKYEKLVAILIQGMKEQQVQIQELKEKLDGITK